MNLNYFILFNGKNIPLNQFIEGCNEAKFMIEPESETNLVKLIRSKIQGEARQAISGRTFLTIDELKTFLKNIYSPARTIPQLLGELGQEFQRDHENVIAFANRIRDIGTRILEASSLENDGHIDVNFRTSIENTMIDSFKRGLKFELEQRLGNEVTENVNDLVQNAISIERKLEAQKNLRKSANMRTEDNHLRMRRMFMCQICNKDGHETKDCKNKLWCSYCKMSGHSLEKCFKAQRNSKTELQNNITCQLCNRQGHTALYCFGMQECQICKKRGHIAKDCFFNKTTNQIMCQLCNKQGHSADRCFTFNKQSKSTIPEVNKVLACQICNKNGHDAVNCRTISTKKECRYCKGLGHTIEECRKRKYNEERKMGNGWNSQVPSAALRENQDQQRSNQMSAIEEFQKELLPLI